MTITTTDAPTAAKPFFARIWDALMTASEAAYKTSEGARCARVASELSQLSDEELAARGLRRDQIVAFAFRGHVWI